VGRVGGLALGIDAVRRRASRGRKGRRAARRRWPARATMLRSAAIQKPFDDRSVPVSTGPAPAYRRRHYSGRLNRAVPDQTEVPAARRAIELPYLAEPVREVKLGGESPPDAAGTVGSATPFPPDRSYPRAGRPGRRGAEGGGPGRAGLPSGAAGQGGDNRSCWDLSAYQGDRRAAATAKGRAASVRAGDRWSRPGAFKSGA